MTDPEPDPGGGHRSARAETRKRRSKYRRARIRNILFTVGPKRLTGGSIARRHLSSDFDLNEVEASSPDWPEAFDGLRIGHVSDFHLGELIPIDRALEAVELLAAQEPDLIACTGDVVDLHHHGADRLLDALGAVDAPMGTTLVLGNHDELHCPSTIRRLAKEAGVTVLDDERVSIHRNGAELIAAGVGWAPDLSGCARRVERTCAEGAHLLLAHNPRAFPAAADHGVALTLAGHTHGGQVAWRNRPNANLALTHRHSAGLFENGPSRLFVTTGVGSWFPLRVNCPAEVAVVTMRHGPPGTESTERRPRIRKKRRSRR